MDCNICILWGFIVGVMLCMNEMKEFVTTFADKEKKGGNSGPKI